MQDGRLLTRLPIIKVFGRLELVNLCVVVALLEHQWVSGGVLNSLQDPLLSILSTQLDVLLCRHLGSLLELLMQCFNDLILCLLHAIHLEGKLGWQWHGILHHLLSGVSSGGLVIVLRVLPVAELVVKGLSVLCA